MAVWQVLLNLSVSLLPTNGIVGIDASGFDRSHASKHYTKRAELIKQHILPTVASTDYRIWFLYFVIGAVMYNVWRVTNLLFRDAAAVHFGYQPPIPADEFIETLAICIVPGD